MACPIPQGNHKQLNDSEWLVHRHEYAYYVVTTAINLYASIISSDIYLRHGFIQGLIWCGGHRGFNLNWKNHDPGCKFPPKVQPGLFQHNTTTLLASSYFTSESDQSTRNFANWTLVSPCASGIFIHRHSIADVFSGVCLFVSQHDIFRTIKHSMTKLGSYVHCTKISPKFKFGSHRPQLWVPIHQNVAVWGVITQKKINKRMSAWQAWATQPHPSVNK